MYETKPYLKNPKIRAALWISFTILFIGGPLLAGFLYKSQRNHEEANSTATEISNDSTTTAKEAIYQVWEATRSYEDQQLLAIVESQRSLIESCQQLQNTGTVQVPAARPAHVVFWLVKEDGENVSKLTWDKPQPPPYSGPSSCLTDPLVSFFQGEGGVVIIQVTHRLVGYYIPEGAPANSTPDTRYPVYDVTVNFCMTDLATQGIIGADKFTLHPPSSVDYPGLPFIPGYAGDPPWRNYLEEWACNISKSASP